LKTRLKKQTDFTWKEKWDPKMKFQQAGYLGQYGSDANTSKIGLDTSQEPLRNFAMKASEIKLEENNEWNT
jgi:hypothetical protein